MKAILGNFTKISDTEFHLKKNMQFAQVSLNQDGIIKTIDYQDKQNIETGDILTHEDIDYEILTINADNYEKLQVTVKTIVQEQDVPVKTKFKARKMSPRKPKISIPRSPIIVKTENDQPVQAVHNTEVKEPTKSKPIEPKPKTRNIFKRFVGWLSSKLSTYSNS